MKIIRISLIILVLIGIGFSGFIAYKEVLKPSYASLISVCNPEKFEEDFSDVYYVSGSVSVSADANIGDGITQDELDVFIADDENLKTIKHELCHVKQFERGVSSSCAKPIRKYFGEVECYVAEELPNFIYGFVYG